MDRKDERDQVCRSCGGRLVLLADVNLHPDSYQQDAHRVIYFRCERCAQVQIAER
jgi:hypothetical protein